MKEERYYLPLHWQEFNEKIEFSEYFVGVQKTVSGVLLVHEVLDETYTWVPVTGEWLGKDGTSYDLGKVICVAKKYPITFPNAYREIAGDREKK